MLNPTASSHTRSVTIHKGPQISDSSRFFLHGIFHLSWDIYDIYSVDCHEIQIHELLSRLMMLIVQSRSNLSLKPRDKPLTPKVSKISHNISMQKRRNWKPLYSINIEVEFTLTTKRLQSEFPLCVNQNGFFHSLFDSWPFDLEVTRRGACFKHVTLKEWHHRH